MTSGSSGDAGAGNTANIVAEQVKNQASQAAGATQQAAGQVTHQAKSMIAGQKDRASDSLSTVAHALRGAGDQLRGQNEETVAQVMDKTAGGVDQLAAYLREKDLNELTGDIENVARRNPALFLAGAFGLGVIAARFLKSSSTQTSGSSTQYGTYRYPSGHTYGTNDSQGSYAASSSGYQSASNRYDDVRGMPDVSQRYAPGLMNRDDTQLPDPTDSSNRG